MDSSTPAIKNSIEYSNQIIYDLREKFSSSHLSNDIAVVTVGSFARREASEQSDLDYFVIVNGSDELTNEVQEVRDICKQSGIKMPSIGGAFDDDSVEYFSNMIRDIGGISDENLKLTRRLLFLLESEWLYNQELYNELFKEFVNIYVKESITEHQLCRFLLNDLIRYYRTICVDFEYKTVEDDKPWGDRNIKLLFSRKLLYFSGIITIAETVQHNFEVKRELLDLYLKSTPIERIKKICGAQCHKAIKMYDGFLDDMAKNEIREMLASTTAERNGQPTEFRTFKNRGHHFTWELSRLLNDTYDPSHPIHNAIKF